MVGSYVDCSAHSFKGFTEFTSQFRLESPYADWLLCAVSCAEGGKSEGRTATGVAAAVVEECDASGNRVPAGDTKKVATQKNRPRDVSECRIRKHGRRPPVAQGGGGVPAHKPLVRPAMHKEWGNRQAAI